MKIVSGGQTGVDRAALDVAIKHGIECGGWCPVGRLDELGKIPERYPLQEVKPHVKEGRSPDRPGGLETAAPWERKRDIFAERTLRNVKDSDGTLVIFFGELRGGTDQTVRFCIEQQRPHELIDAAKVSPERAAELIVEFVRDKKIATLNVAGPCQSDWSDGYDYAFHAMDIFLGASSTSKNKNRS